MRTTCPGCGKHCPLSEPRCKYGRMYAERQNQNATQTKKKSKWEKYVEPNGTAYRFLHAARLTKKALSKEKITEEQLLRNLSAEERETLVYLLGKLDWGRKPEL